MVDIPVPGNDILGLPTPDEAELEQLRARYNQLAHAIQTGVMMMMEYDPKEATPKSLRTGLNVCMCDHGALAHLLINTGVIKEKDYYKASCAMLEQEASRYKQRIEDAIEARTGKRPNITLG